MLIPCVNLIRARPCLTPPASASPSSCRIDGTITEALQAPPCAAGLLSSGHVEIHAVPGAFEIPQAARAAAETGRIDAVICLGCVVRGATAHFEYISGSVAHGIQQAAGDTGVPMAFGVLTTDTWEQAEERAVDGREQGMGGGGRGHRMAVLFRQLRAAERTAAGTGSAE